MKNMYSFSKHSLTLLALIFINLSIVAQSGIYVGGHFRRQRTITVPTLKASGFTYVILFNIQVETNGDLTMDSEKLCSNGVYTFNATQPNYIADVTSLKSGMTSVIRVESCIGGWTSTSYNNIKALITAQGTGPSSILYKNFQALKLAIPAIDAINNDDESAYDVSTATDFSVMLFDLGYKTTLAPYMNKSFWQSVAANVNKARPGAVDRIDLQIYEGGAGNNPKDWDFSIPLSTGMLHFNPSTTITSTMSGWKNNSTATSGFLWVYNDNDFNLQTYAAAITKVFGGGEVVNRDIMRPVMTAFTEPDYLGLSVNFDKGNYKIAGISAQNFPDKSISSLKLTPGFKALLFKKNNLTGSYVTVTDNSPDLSAFGINDSISSWVVRPNGDLSFTGKTVYLRNRKSGLYMSVSGESMSQGANIQQQPYSGNEDQKWVLTNIGDGAYRLLNRSSKIGIQVRKSGMDDGAIVEQLTYAGQDNQKFIIVQNGTSGYFKLIPVHSIKYIKPADDHVNANIVQGGLFSDTDTDWELISMFSIMKPQAILYPDCLFAGQGVNFETGSYPAAAMALSGLNNNTLSSIQVTQGFSATLYDGDNFTGNSLPLTEDNDCLTGISFDNLTTSLVVKPNGTAGKDGLYYLQNRNSLLYMAVASGSEMEGANIVQNNYSGTNAQQWVLTGFGDGVYKLTNQKSGMAVTLAGNRVGAPIGQNTFSDLDNQKFVLFPATEGGSYKLVAILSGNVLDVNGANAIDGALLEQSINENQLSAEWKLVSATEMGVDTHKAGAGLRVYPNPIADDLFIDQGNYTISKIHIIDLQGNILKEYIQSSNKVNVSSLNPGMYLVNVFVDGNPAPVVLKFIKTR